MEIFVETNAVLTKVTLKKYNLIKLNIVFLIYIIKN